MNPYTTLGVPPRATRQEITAAFRGLAMDCHPDLHPGDSTAAARFIELQHAYEEALANLGRRETSSHLSGRPPLRRDARREVRIDIARAVRGGTVRIDGATGPCQECAGEGHVRSAKPVECETCAGSGISGYRERGIIRVKVTCPDCAGSGRTTRIRCTACAGFGTASGTDLEIDLPPGVRDGDVFTIVGGAGDPDGNVAGDLEIVVRIDGGSYRIVRDDIESDMEIEVWEAALGSSKEIASPEGRLLRLSVPPGSRHGRRFRLKGRGLGSGSGRGDFVVVLSVRVPDASSGTAKEAFERLKRELSRT